MSKNEGVQKVLRTLIEDHRNRGLEGRVRVFTWDTEYIAELLQSEEVCDDYTDAIDLIEQVTSQRDNFHYEDWVISYDYVRELWIFERMLDFPDIVRDSFTRKEIVAERIRTIIANLEPREFEGLLLHMFEVMPNIELHQVRPQSHDGGFEMILISNEPITGAAEWVLVQAKQQSKNVSVSQVRELLGSVIVESNKKRERRYRGLMISTLPATYQAIKTAKESGSLVDFIGLDQLVDLMIKYDIGWKKETLEFATIDDSFWRDVEDSDV